MPPIHIPRPPVNRLSATTRTATLANAFLPYCLWIVHVHDARRPHLSTPPPPPHASGLRRITTPTGPQTHTCPRRRRTLHDYDAGQRRRTPPPPWLRTVYGYDARRRPPSPRSTDCVRHLRLLTFSALSSGHPLRRLMYSASPCRRDNLSSVHLHEVVSDRVFIDFLLVDRHYGAHLRSRLRRPPIIHRQVVVTIAF